MYGIKDGITHLTENAASMVEVGESSLNDSGLNDFNLPSGRKGVMIVP